MFRIINKLYPVAGAAVPENNRNKKSKNNNNNKKYNNYFGKLPIASNKRSFLNNRNCNLTKKNNKRMRNRKCEFLKKTKDDKLFSINENLFADDIKVLSRPKDSASNSIVLYNNHNGYGYVYKISPDNPSIKKESEIYERLNQLIFHKVCPHLFLTFGSGIITLPEDDTNVKKLIYEVELKVGQQHYCQVNETGPDTKLIMPFYKLFADDDLQPDTYGNSIFLSDPSKSKNFARVFYNLIFQYYWVQYIFSLIGFTQGDTHFANIMLIFNKINIFDNPDDESFKPENIKYRSYTFKKAHSNPDSETKTYYLEDLGIDLYIYDFDKGNFMNGVFTDMPRDFYKFTRIIDMANEGTKVENIMHILESCETIHNTCIFDAIKQTLNNNNPLTIDEFMYYYSISILFNVPYLEEYKDIYMLVSDKPDTDRPFKSSKSSKSSKYSGRTLYNKKERLEIEKSHYPSPEMFESIKSRVHGSYSTEPLFKVKGDANNNFVMV